MLNWVLEMVTSWKGSWEARSHRELAQLGKRSVRFQPLVYDVSRMWWWVVFVETIGDEKHL